MQSRESRLQVIKLSYESIGSKNHLTFSYFVFNILKKPKDWGWICQIEGFNHFHVVHGIVFCSSVQCILWEFSVHILGGRIHPIVRNSMGNIVLKWGTLRCTKLHITIFKFVGTFHRRTRGFVSTRTHLTAGKGSASIQVKGFGHISLIDVKIWSFESAIFNYTYIYIYI